MRLWSPGIIVGIALATATPTELSAADLRDVLTDYSITSWSLKDGMPSDVISAVTQDRLGYLWLGTSAGLVRFDGARFVVWSEMSTQPLPPHPVESLHLARDGSLWVGFSEHGGISRILDGAVTTYGENSGIVGNSVNTIVEDRDGVIIAGLSRGAYALSGQRWRRIFGEESRSESAVYGASIDRTGLLLLATGAGIFRREADGRFSRIGPYDKIARSVTDSNDGRVFATHDVNGAIELMPDSAAVPRGGLGRGAVTLRDRRGHVWVGTRGQGLWRLTRTPAGAFRAEHANMLTGLPSNWVISLHEDRDGVIWAGTTRGLSRLLPQVFTSFVDSGTAQSLDVDGEGRVWVATIDELLCLETHGAGEAKPVKLPVPAGRISTLRAAADGTLWAATADGLFRFIAGRLVPIDPRLLSRVSSIRQIAPISRDEVWLIDSRAGLLALHGQQLRAYAVAAFSHAVPLWLMTDRTGAAWLSVSNGSVYIVTRDGQVRSLSENEGFVSDLYETMFEADDGTIWLGGTRGLARYGNGRFSSFRGVGSPIDRIRAIAEDREGRLWLGTSRGIVRVDPREFERTLVSPPHHVRYTYFDVAEGAAGFTANGRAVRGRDGRIWFLTGRDVTVVDPATIQSPRAARPVIIEGLQVDDRLLATSSRLVLDPQVSRITIDYTLPELTSPRHLLFRYRLDGFDENWVEVGSRRRASYTNLPPGDYRFRVEANSNQSSWNENESVLTFSIAPKFHQTATAKTLALLSITLAIFAVWRIRLWQMHRRYSLLLSERIRLSNEIHDTLLQGLVGVGLQSDALLLALEPSNTTVRRHLSRLRQTIDLYIDEARHAIWNLRSPLLEKTDLVTALRTSGERAVAGTSVVFNFELEGTPRPCTPKIEEQLLRIAQEAMANSIRHSQAGHVRMRLEFSDEDGSIALTVCDDGRGMPQTLDRTGEKHYGLATMTTRAESVGGQLSVRSAPDKGTEVRAVVPRLRGAA